MNETITVELKREGMPLRINQLTAEGIVIDNETDAPPRGLSVVLRAREEYTRDRMRRVQELQGWAPGVFKLECKARDGVLVLRGAEENSRGLPMGNYWLRVEMADLICDGDAAITLEEGEQEKLTVKVRQDPRNVVLAGPVESFDREVARVLTAPESAIDGLAVKEWLASPQPRARRKACLLNVMAKLRAAPSVREPLIAHLGHVFFADVDRIYASVDGQFLTRLTALADDPRKPFYREGVPNAPIHRQLLERMKPFTPDTTGYRLESFRQEGRNCLQAVVAQDPRTPEAAYADLDIDLGNPLQDLQGLLIHFGEILAPGKTDHFSLRQSLAQGDTADFMYYRIAKRTD